MTDSFSWQDADEALLDIMTRVDRIKLDILNGDPLNVEQMLCDTIEAQSHLAQILREVVRDLHSR